MSLESAIGELGWDVFVKPKLIAAIKGLVAKVPNLTPAEQAAQVTLFEQAIEDAVTDGLSEALAAKSGSA